MMLYMPTALSVPLTKYELHFPLSRHESLLEQPTRMLRLRRVLYRADQTKIFPHSPRLRPNRPVDERSWCHMKSCNRCVDLTLKLELPDIAFIAI